MQQPEPAEMLDRVRAQPWGGPLLDALSGVEGVHLVGGPVRDLLLGRDPVDVDLVVVGDAAAIARELAARLGGSATEHERFGTATVNAPGLPAINVVTARRERYAHPGALPDVEAGTLEKDLARRDFTVNALALGLDGHITAVPDGREDLDAGLIRVLHDASFRDDPTRLLRAVRYATRLGFALEPGTEALARRAKCAGALDTVSGARIRDELLDLLGEEGAPRSVALLDALGLAAPLHLEPRGELVSGAWALAPSDARRDLIALAACTSANGTWLEHLALTAPEQRIVTRGMDAPALAERLRHALSPSQIAAELEGEPAEAVALAGALGAEEQARRWFDELRDVRLEITGDDLLAAGAREGPAVGRALRAALDRKLDGELDGRDAELAAALSALQAD